jgi:hypothetical protein
VASNHEDERDRPHVWPFTFAGLLVLVALSWFCAGFALHDLGQELPAFYKTFFVLISIAFALIVGGAAVNITREQRRRAH